MKQKTNSQIQTRDWQLAEGKRAKWMKGINCMRWMVTRLTMVITMWLYKCQIITFIPDIHIHIYAYIYKIPILPQ